MSNKYTIEEVYNIIDNEGFLYAVTEYMSGDSIEDEKLAKMWNEADKILRETKNKIEKYIEKHMKEDDDEITEEDWICVSCEYYKTKQIPHPLNFCNTCRYQIVGIIDNNCFDNYRKEDDER